MSQRPWTKKNHTVGESGRGEIWGKSERMMGAPEHACVRVLCYECDEMIDGRVLVPKGIPPLTPFLFFVNFSITLVPRTHLVSSKKIHSIFLNFQLSTSLGRGLLPNKVTQQTEARYV